MATARRRSRSGISAALDLSAEAIALPALALSQPLHELTVALLHLACMRRLAEIVPPRLSATALTLYGTVRDRRRQRGADSGLGRALRRGRGRGLPGHGGVVRRRVAHRATAVRLRGHQLFARIIID